MKELSRLINEIGSLKSKARSLKEEYDKLQESIYLLQQDLLGILNDSQMQSAKTKDYGVSITKRKNFLITNEAEVLDWLKNEPNIEYDHYVGIRKAEFSKLASDWLQKTGEVIAGTNLQMRDTLTLRKVK